MASSKISKILSKTGLTEAELDTICSVFRTTPAITRAILFGSRAKGTAKHYSDIDFAIEGSLNERQIAEVAMKLEELPLPYKFDVKSLASIRHLPLKEHIDRVGITIYRKAGDSAPALAKSD